MRMTRALILLLVLLAAAPGYAQQVQKTDQITATDDAVTLVNASRLSAASITVTGTYSGTLRFQVLGADGTTWVTRLCSVPGTAGSTASSTTSTGSWECSVGGWRALRVVESPSDAWTSGTAVVSINYGSGGGVSSGGSSGGGGSGDASEAEQQVQSALLTDIESAVDGLEALIGTGNTSLGNIDTDATTIIGHVDGIETLLGTSNTSLATIAGDTTDIETAVELLDNAAGTTPADNFSNPTGALTVFALMGCWDAAGTNWDRCQPGSVGAGVIDTGTTRVVVASDDDVSDAATLLEATLAVVHDDVDAGNTFLNGYRAIAHGTNPTAVAAGDRTRAYANRAGIPFFIGGHPNAITETVQVTDADGAQTGTAVVTVSAGTKIVVTRVAVRCSNANSGNVDFRAAFDTDGTFTAASEAGVVGEIASFDGIPAGGGEVEGNGAGILGIGADDEDLRYSLSDPAGGSCTASFTYYTIES